MRRQKHLSPLHPHSTPTTYRTLQINSWDVRPINRENVFPSRQWKIVCDFFTLSSAQTEYHAHPLRYAHSSLHLYCTPHPLLLFTLQAQYSKLRPPWIGLEIWPCKQSERTWIRKRFREHVPEVGLVKIAACNKSSSWSDECRKLSYNIRAMQTKLGFSQLRPLTLSLSLSLLLLLCEDVRVGYPTPNNFFTALPFLSCHVSFTLLLFDIKATTATIIIIIIIIQLNSYLFKNWGFHGGDYEEWRLLGCYVVWLL
jgi:hypothetical protein